MKKSIFFFAAIAAMFSCAKENPTIETPAQETFTVELTASAPTSDDVPAPASADTRTTLVDGPVVDGKPSKFVHWSQEDAIKVLFFPNHKDDHVIQGPSGIFTSHFDAESSSHAYFRTEKWSWGDIYTSANDARISRLMLDGIAVYPSTAVAISRKNSDIMNSKCESEVSFVLPAEQNAIVGNIESGLNFSYATVNLNKFISTIDNGSETALSFKNACAMIELTMPSTLDKKVTSISLISNTNVPLTGKGTVKLTGYNNIIASPFGVDVTEGGGVVLNSANGFEAGAKYYAVVWPGEHDSLTIEFMAEDGTVATKTTPSVTLTASKVKPYTFSKGLEFVAPVKEFNYFYADGSTGNEVNSNIVGVVIFRGNPKTQFNDPDLPKQYCNGLAIGTKNVSTYWGGTSALSNVPASVKMSSYSTAHANGGYTVKKIWNNNGFNSLPMYTNSSKVDISKYNTSGWYLPVNNEWNYILANISDINALLTAAGADTINLSSSRSSAYWLPLAYSSNAITIYTDYYGTKAAYYYDWQYNTNRNVRPIFAF